MGKLRKIRENKGKFGINIAGNRMTKEVKPNEVEAEEVEITNLNEYAIIKSFECLGDDKQRRKHILNKAIELTSKEITDRNEDAMRQVLKKLVESKYIIRISHGVYQLNPAFKFVPRGLALTIEKDCTESFSDHKPEFETAEISSEQTSESSFTEIPSEHRMAHTANLMDKWREFRKLQ